MTTFAVIAQEDNTDLAAAVKRVFPNAFYKIGPGQFVVSSSKFTPQGVTTALGGENGAYGSLIVMVVTAYWGYHDQSLWEWLVKQGTP